MKEIKKNLFYLFVIVVIVVIGVNLYIEKDNKVEINYLEEYADSGSWDNYYFYSFQLNGMKMTNEQLQGYVYGYLISQVKPVDGCIQLNLYDNNKNLVVGRKYCSPNDIPLKDDCLYNVEFDDNIIKELCFIKY